MDSFEFFGSIKANAGSVEVIETHSGSKAGSIVDVGKLLAACPVAFAFCEQPQKGCGRCCRQLKQIQKQVVADSWSKAGLDIPSQAVGDSSVQSWEGQLGRLEGQLRPPFALNHQAEANSKGKKAQAFAKTVEKK